MLSRLDGKLLSDLHLSLLETFDHGELELFLRTLLDVRIHEISLGAEGFADVVTAVISWAERRGRIPTLLDALVAARPGRPEFERIRQQFAARLKHGGPGESRPDAAAPPTVGGAGARSVDPVAVLSWAQAMGRASASVALLEVGENTVSTAMALTRRLLLCPSFVVQEQLDDKSGWHEVRATFGYGSTAKGAPPRQTWALDRDVPVVDHDADLGFAVLLLGEPLPPEASPGSLQADFEAAMKGPPEVRAIATSRSKVEEGTPLFLLGHALGGAIGLEATFAVGVDGDVVRYQHDGGSRPGLAGAPVLTENGRAIAMHQGAKTDEGGAGSASGLRLQAVLDRPLVKLAIAVGKPPPEGMSVEQMAI